jgi:hypothetical protein
MSNRPFLLMVFGALFMSGAVLNSHAASGAQTSTARPAIEDAAEPATTTEAAPPSLTCELLCHSTAECSAGTTPCGVCVIPPGSFFGHCTLKK